MLLGVDYWLFVCIFFHFALSVHLFLSPSFRFYVLLQGEGVLEVQQPAPAGGAGLPPLHPQRLPGLRADARGPRALASRRRRLGRCDRAGRRGQHGEGHSHRRSVRAGAVPAGAGLHGGAVQAEGHAAPHTVLQTLHAGMGLKRWTERGNESGQQPSLLQKNGGRLTLDSFNKTHGLASSSWGWGVF